MSEDYAAKDYAVIRTFLDISTKNITQKDAEILEANGNDLTMLNYEEGFFIHTGARGGPGNEANVEKEAMSHFENLGFSEAFLKLIRYARERMCDYVMIDRDADENIDLELFEW